MPPVTTVQVVATLLVTLIALVVLSRPRLGPNADWIEVVRATLLPPLDRLLERTVGGVGTAYQLGEREHVGRIDAPPEAVEGLLWQAGFRRNYLAAYKRLEDGRREVGSWAYRGDEVGEKKQLHVMLFSAKGDRTDVYAHVEYSSATVWLLRNPTVLRRHYRGVAYSPASGARVLRQLLQEGVWASQDQTTSKS